MSQLRRTSRSLKRSTWLKGLKRKERQKRRKAAQLEQLEDRRLLAGDVAQMVATAQQQGGSGTLGATHSPDGLRLVLFLSGDYVSPDNLELVWYRPNDH